MRQNYIDERVPNKYTKSASAGDESLLFHLPSSIPGKIEIRDLRVMAYNSTGARGVINAYTYTWEGAITTAEYIMDGLISDTQLATTHLLFGSIQGSVCPPGKKVALGVDFYNCVSADTIGVFFTYTVRRFH